MEAKKKENIFKKIKRWWKEELTEDDRDLFKIVGIWTFDGAMLGSLITGGLVHKKMTKQAKASEAVGYINGKLDAYKEMAQYPMGMMDAGMKKLEQQGKVKKF